MARYEGKDSFGSSVLEGFQALLVGSAGAAAMIALLCIVQLLVQGEVTLFTDNFWLKEEQKP
jgi:hypothetical protein